jgi:hypothetical protein
VRWMSSRCSHACAGRECGGGGGGVSLSLQAATVLGCTTFSYDYVHESGADKMFLTRACGGVSAALAARCGCGLCVRHRVTCCKVVAACDRLSQRS